MAQRKDQNNQNTQKKKKSFLGKMISYLYPCIKKNKNNKRRGSLKSILIDNTTQMDEINNYNLQNDPIQQHNEDNKDQHIQQRLRKQDTDVQDYFEGKILLQNIFDQYLSVSRYQQDKLTLFGFEDRIALKFYSKNLQLSSIAEEKTRIVWQKLKNKPEKFPSTQIQNCWKKRYTLFSRFDDGIKFDFESYISTPPEALTNYLASRIRCNKLIHAFGGIGAYDIKLSNTCEQIVIHNISYTSKQCLLNNLQIYQIDNVEISHVNFLDIQTTNKFDVVLITPPWGMNYSLHQQFDVNQLKIDTIFSKALEVSSNVVMVLPSNINIVQVTEILCKSLYDNQNKYSSFSFEVEKIYFMNKLRFIVLYYGSLVQKQIKLHDELDIIYKIIGNKTQTCKNILKYIKEQYGLPFLLRLCTRAELQAIKGNIYDRLIQITEQNKLLNENHLKSFNHSTSKASFATNTSITNNNSKQEFLQESIRTQTVTNSYMSQNSLTTSIDFAQVRGTIIVGASQEHKMSLKLNIDPMKITKKI